MVKALLDSDLLTKGYVQNYRFLYPERRFEIDFAYPEKKAGIEIQGGQYMKKSGHNSATGLSRDYEKQNLALLNGWKILQYGTAEVRKNPFKILNEIKFLISGQKPWH
jgi:very-short-patch-repair endonuclease